METPVELYLFQEPHHGRVVVQGQQAVNVIGGELPQHEAIGHQHRLHATDRSPVPTAPQPNYPPRFPLDRPLAFR